MCPGRCAIMSPEKGTALFPAENGVLAPSGGEPAGPGFLISIFSEET